MNYANEQVTLTVMIGSEMLCGVAMHPKYNLVTWGQDQCIIDIRREPTYWCITVESRDQWDHGSNMYKLEIKRGRFPQIESEIILDFKPNAEAPCMTKDQHGRVLQYDKINPTPNTNYNSEPQ